MEVKNIRVVMHPDTKFVKYGVFEGDTMLSWMGTNFVKTRYCREYLSALTIGGIGTHPMYRRRGCVRMMMEHVIEDAMENNVSVALLHPFSFAYYRKFGFERVSDHLIVDFPMSAISYFERCADFEEYTDESQLPDLLEVYRNFTCNRNLMFERLDGAHYPAPGDKEHRTFLHRDAEGHPDAYLTVELEQKSDINRLVGVCLHVLQFAFTTKPALEALFGFLRMYEGEMDSIRFENVTMCPEIDMLLRNYMHTSYRVVPDIMARVLDVEAFLKANLYPRQHGHFILRVNDVYDKTAGCYDVEYGDGKAEIVKKALSDTYDLAADIRALSQLFYGVGGYTPETARYLAGVELKNDADDFFAVFRKKYGGVFEHF